MPDLVPIKRALISVSDKSGLLDFARALAELGVEIVSTGGTARALAEAGLAVVSVDSLTGFPEMMDGRVKTLHPRVHGGILALRDEPDHAAALREHGIAPIDLVCVNLYPFERTIARPGVTRDEAIEQIDVGGPAMIRAAAKNHEWVAVVTDPGQYQTVAREMRDTKGAVSKATRAGLAHAAFVRTSAYDATIAGYLGRSSTSDELPASLQLAMPRVQSMRYGENPHQRAALYRDALHAGPSIAAARQLHGKELSYNNVNDAAAALALALDLSAASGLASGTPLAGCCVIKHANPCGAAVAAQSVDAVRSAMAGDPLAAYGGILALRGTLDEPAAALLAAPGVFLEVVIAQGFTAGALDLLRARSSGLRLLEVGTDEPEVAPLTFRSIPGGALVQTADSLVPDPARWELKAGPAPSAERLADAAVIAVIAKHLSSNAIALGGRAAVDGPGAGPRLFGAGAGQMDRVASCKLAVEKAGALAKGAIVVGDAFFPFPDGPEILIRAGVTMIVHPGGSKRDQETFDLCARHGVSCLTTGTRHFRH
ncbi:MAG: bifunctional phosphoribosylaminoimidazolecarboxamide formyltransferase/IMP cyclohydrolase [Planctomycetota bacterium]|nr:bifunctional phosphoribosylaminoimidazolecarboxamide formyltransferase/IMP cyclohydrolase [Planctomycetota bacterium]